MTNHMLLLRVRLKALYGVSGCRSSRPLPFRTISLKTKFRTGNMVEKLEDLPPISRVHSFVLLNELRLISRD